MNTVYTLRSVHPKRRYAWIGKLRTFRIIFYNVTHSFWMLLSSAFSVLCLMQQGNKSERGPDSYGSMFFIFAEQINKVLVSQKSEDLRAIITLENCYGLNCVSPNSYVEVLVP